MKFNVIVYVGLYRNCNVVHKSI